MTKILAPLLLLVSSSVLAAGPSDALPDAAALAKIAALEKRVSGRIGFYALDVDSGRTLENRPDDRFAMCSSFKWLLASQLLEEAAEGKSSLETKVPYGEKELEKWAPVAREHVKEGGMSVGALCDAAVEHSDNTAANLLLPRAGGPAGLTAFLRAHGDAVTRLDRGEPELNENREGDPRDTTTPRAMGDDLRRFLLGDVLRPPARERVLHEMEQCVTGTDRLRAGIPKGWRAADKTGTCGSRGALNDVGIIWPPGQGPIVVVAMQSDSSRPGEELESVIAELAKIAMAAFGARVTTPR